MSVPSKTVIPKVMRFWKTASLLDTQQNWMHYILTERTSDNIGAHSEAPLW